MSKHKPSEASTDAATSAQVRPAPEPERRTVDAWAQILLPSRGPSGRLHPELWKYSAARSLHRWHECEHHTGKPMSCTREDFLAALKAAEEPPYAPHKPVLFTLTRSAD